MSNTPDIRFKGFIEPWEQRKVGDIAGRTYGGGTPKTSVEEYWDGEIPWVQSSNLSEHELFNVNIQKHITELGLQKSAAQLVPKNSIAVVSHVGVGKLVFLPFDYTTSQDFISLSELKTEPIFTCYVLYKRLQEDLHIVQGSAIKGITKEDLLGKEITVPSEFEQRKIGAIMQNFDNLITLHQRKCNEMSELKKFMLQKMFPKNGEQFPEIRFGGFTEPWEQCKLGDIADVTKLAGFEFTEHVVYSDEGNIIALRGLNIKNGQLDLNDVKYIDGSNFSKLNRSKLYIDDIMFTYVGTVGEVAIIKENDRFYLAPNVSRIRVQSEASPKFVSHYMRTENFYRYVIFPLIATSSQPALSMENIRKFEISLPKRREEQDKLSEYFDNIDNLITLHQRKRDELKDLKKFMLQNMFPKKG